MENKIKIKNALISVFDNEGLEKIVKLLASFNIEIYSTGRTEKFIKNHGIEVHQIEKLNLHQKQPLRFIV